MQPKPLQGQKNVCTSWVEFIDKYYEKQPCIIALDKIDGLPFTEKQALDAISAAFSEKNTAKIHSPKERRIHINNLSIDQPLIKEDSLPKNSEDFEHFINRYFSDSKADDLTLVLHNCHQYDRSIYTSARKFLKPLQDQIGLPSAFVGTDLFAGKYRTNPKGLHKDTGAVFMFPLINEKKMLVWPWETFSSMAPESRFQNASLKDVNYKDFLDCAVVLQGEPGQCIYFPSHWWHMAYSENLNPTLALNITWYMPSTVGDFIMPTLKKVMAGSILNERFDHLPVMNESLLNEDQIKLPSQVQGFLNELESSLKRHYLQRLSAGGFFLSDAPKHERSGHWVPEKVKLSEKEIDIKCVSQSDGNLVLTANGKSLRTKSTRDLKEFVIKLNSGNLIKLNALDDKNLYLPLLMELEKTGVIELQ